MADGVKILGISGSLRRGSYNTMALEAARRLLPAGAALELHGLRDIPAYDDGVRVAGFPPAVTALRDAVRAADALLLATPEYNYSFSGVLKNAIDWVSRPPEQPFADKPIAVMSASMGVLGGVRAQYHLRQCFIFLDAKLLNRPEVMIGQAQGKFAADGTLTDEPTAKILGELLQALVDWTRRLEG
jgi:chromate reductase